MNAKKLSQLMEDYNRSITPYAEPREAMSVILLDRYVRCFDAAQTRWAHRIPSADIEIQEKTFVAIAISLDLETALDFAIMSEMDTCFVIRAIIEYMRHLEYVKINNQNKVLEYLISTL